MMWRVKGTTQMSTSRVHPRKVAVSNKEADSLTPNYSILFKKSNCKII